MEDLWWSLNQRRNGNSTGICADTLRKEVTLCAVPLACHWYAESCQDVPWLDTAVIGYTSLVYMASWQMPPRFGVNTMMDRQKIILLMSL